MTKEKPEGLTKEERLTQFQVSRLFADSRLVKGKYFVIRVMRNNLNYNRIAAIASKKAGKAHVRNRIKRRIRTIFRQNKDCFPQGLDLAIIARYGVANAAYSELIRSYKDVAQKVCALYSQDSSNAGNTSDKIPLSESNRSHDA